MMFDPDLVPSISIPDGEFEDNSYPGNEGSRLIATVRVNGVLFHVDAIEAEIRDDLFVAKDPMWEDEMDALYAAVHADGWMHTVTIKGREYALVISPFCR